MQPTKKAKLKYMVQRDLMFRTKALLLVKAAA